SLLCSFSDTATTEIYTLSLHDALPIYKDDSGIGFSFRNVLHKAKYLDENLAVFEVFLSNKEKLQSHFDAFFPDLQRHVAKVHAGDRKSTRLNSSHVKISYAVFCLKKKK